MAQIQPQWEIAEDFNVLASRVIEKYPEHFSQIELDQIIAYVCVNKERPDKNKKPYDIGGILPPESFTNSKTYFVKMFQNIWEQTEEQKLCLVYSVLKRIDVVSPGKLKPLDYSDQEEMVERFGANWHSRGNLPNILTQDIDVR